MIRTLKAKRIGGVGLLTIVTCVLVLALMSGSVLAAILVTKTVPGTVRVMAVHDLTLWANSACTTPLTEVDYGDVAMSGGTSGVNFYIRNDSDEALYVRGSSDLPGSKGTLDFQGLNTGGLVQPGLKVTASTMLTLLPNPQGDINFTITIHGQDNS